MYELTKFGLNTNYVEHQLPPPEGLTPKIFTLGSELENPNNKTSRCSEYTHGTVHRGLRKAATRERPLQNGGYCMRTCPGLFPP
jgi:hypothetical protein